MSEPEDTMSLQRKVAARDGVRKGARSRQHKVVPAKSDSKKAQQSLETRERLLDAAEELFANFGLYGVTVRNVSEHVGVDSALIPYYFGTKRGMFDAVFARRAETINSARMEAMAAYEASVGGQVTVEGVLRAFLSPILENDRHQDPGWRNFSALVALANNSKEWGGEMMSRYFDSVIHRLIQLLRKAMPDAKPADLYWSYQMLSGSLMVIQASTGRIELLSNDECRSDDVDAFSDRLIDYAAAGFRAVCKPGPTTAPKRKKAAPGARKTARASTRAKRSPAKSR